MAGFKWSIKRKKFVWFIVTGSYRLWKVKKTVLSKIFKSSGSSMSLEWQKLKKSKKRFFVECQTTVNIVLGDLLDSQCPQGFPLLQTVSSSSRPHSDKPISLPPTDLKET